MGCASDWKSGGASLIPAGSGSIPPVEIIIKYFLPSFLSSADSRRAVVSFW